MHSSIFFIGLNKIGEIKLIFPKHDPDQSISEIMSSFLIQFYENKNVPKLIIINEDIKDKKLIEKALTTKEEKKYTN